MNYLHLKYHKSLFGFALLLMLFTLLAITPVSARTPKVQTTYGAVTIAELGVEEPAILASNPFYGLSDLVRGMKDSFASGRFEKAEAKLATLNLKAAQLLKIRSVAPDNTKALNKALTEYQLAVYQYTIVAARLTTDDFLGIDGSDSVPLFIDSSLIHLRLVDDLLAASQATFDQALLAEIFERLEQVTVKLFVDDIGLKTVRLHMIAALPSDPLIAMRNAEMIAGLAKEATALEYTDPAQELMAMRVVLLDMSANMLSPLAASLMAVSSPASVSNLPLNQIAYLSILAGSPAERIQTLSYLLSTSQFAQDSDLIALRNQLLIKVFSK